MITEIYSHGFKGLDFKTSIGQNNLFIGPTGSGKSSRSLALQLAINGHIAVNGTAYKRSNDILDAFGSGKIVVGFKCNETTFEKSISRGPKGGVSQSYRVNGTKATETHYIRMMSETGVPTIFDVAGFMSLSDQKKIDMIFSLFPPAGNIEKLSSDIEATKEDINNIAGEIRSSNGAIKTLSTSLSQIDLPAGTLAETSTEIERTEKDIAVLRQQIEDEKIRIAEEKAKEAEKKRVEQKALQKGSTEECPDIFDYVSQNYSTVVNDVASTCRPGEWLSDQISQTREPYGEQQPSEPLDITASIKAIISALDESGCKVCAAKFVARQELKKYQTINGGRRP
jgi:energy-coupling factor transporter ATP-binding protein EcfA2